jgi:hypothetical protein
MPYCVASSAPLLRVEFSGTLGEGDFTGMLRELDRFEAGEVVYDRRLTDLSEVREIAVRLPEIYTLAQNRRRNRLREPIRSAVVAVTPVQLGLARMFQSLNDNPAVQVRIFADATGALAWLDESAEAPG